MPRTCPRGLPWVGADLAEKNPDAANKEFDAAIQADPKSLFAVQAKVSALLAEKRIKEAIQITESVASRGTSEMRAFTRCWAVFTLADSQNDKASCFVPACARARPQVGRRPARSGSPGDQREEGRGSDQSAPGGCSRIGPISPRPCAPHGALRKNGTVRSGRIDPGSSAQSIAAPACICELPAQGAVC